VGIPNALQNLVQLVKNTGLISYMLQNVKEVHVCRRNELHKNNATFDQLSFVCILLLLCGKC